MTVINPQNNEAIDLTSLFTIMADQGLSLHGPTNMARRVQRVHDFISTHPPLVASADELQQWSRANTILIELRKTFEQMEGDPAKVQALMPLDA